jgi:hypothetical protein
MIIVSDETIDLAIEELNQLETEQANELMDHLAEDQPEILGYIAAMTEFFSEDDTKDLLMFYFLVIWKAFLIEASAIPRIKEEQIYESEERSKILADNFTQASDIEKLQETIKSIRQAPLLSYITLEILEPEEDLDLSEEEQWQLFSILQICIDIFDDVLDTPKFTIHRN